MTTMGIFTTGVFASLIVFIICLAIQSIKNHHLFNIAEVVYDDISDSRAFELTILLAKMGWDITTKKDIETGLYKVYGRKRYILNKRENENEDID